MPKVFILCATFLVFTGCVGEIPVVGLDQDGKAIETMIPRSSYKSVMAKSIEGIQNAALSALHSERARNLKNLSEVRVGLGIRGEVGVGSVFNLGGNLGIKAVFASDSSEIPGS